MTPLPQNDLKRTTTGIAPAHHHHHPRGLPRKTKTAPVLETHVVEPCRVQWTEGRHGAWEFEIRRDHSRFPITGVVWAPEAKTKATVYLQHGSTADAYDNPHEVESFNCTGLELKPYILAKHLVELKCKVVSMGSLSTKHDWHSFHKTYGWKDHVESDWKEVYLSLVEDGTIDPDLPAGFWGCSMGAVIGSIVIGRRAIGNLHAAVLGKCADGEKVEPDVHNVECPVLYRMQLDDEMCSVAKGMAYFGRLGSKDRRILAYPGLHQNGPDECVDDIVRFMSGKLGLNFANGLVDGALSALSDSRAGSRSFAIPHRRDGIPITGAVWKPSCLAVAVVYLQHDSAGDCYDDLVQSEVQLQDAVTCTGLELKPHIVARQLAALGCIVISIDAPFHGRRDRTKGASSPRDQWRSFVKTKDWKHKIEDEWRTVYEALVADQTIDPSLPAGFWGLGMGGVIGTVVVGRQAVGNIRAAVLGKCSDGAFTEPDVFEIDCPVLYRMQLNDELASEAQCMSYFRKLGSEDKRLLACPGKHREGPDECAEDAVNFLATKLWLKPGTYRPRGQACTCFCM